ncbi:MAG: aminopeptidase P family N-terminal domain-containing protein, partial [Proteobacteria bacterium]|nr:aminopeptidase P family N-terminal domain-containing protein [Pseudomonadota bacterium]
MNHEDWIRQELEPLSKALGFQYVPKEEIEGRLNRLRDAMKETGMEALLVIQKIDYYYLSGTAQDSLLFVPLEGKPLLMVKRELE